MTKIEEDDHIVKVVRSVQYFIETLYSDYRRDESGLAWEIRYGETWEPVYDSRPIEKLFQEYIKNASVL